jgi:hypothetical protein
MSSQPHTLSRPRAALNRGVRPLARAGTNRADLIQLVNQVIDYPIAGLAAVNRAVASRAGLMGFSPAGTARDPAPAAAIRAAGSGVPSNSAPPADRHASALRAVRASASIAGQPCTVMT